MLSCALLASCVHSTSQFCGHDKVCPDKTVCDSTHDQCVATDAFTVCKGVADGTRCTDKLRDGICDQGVCIPGCGDGIQDTADTVTVAEECDDGNNADHDGCAAVCKVEKPVWVPWQNVWTGRSGHVAAFDSDRNVAVVFGGSIESGPTDDLWERDATGAWTQKTIARPPARTQAVMAYDKNRHVMVLFGGAAALGTMLGDTWEYDGTKWTQKSVSGPSPRTGSTMIYDEKEKTILLFGGFEGVPSTHPLALLNDLWKYDGTSWTALSPATSPAARREHAMTWDSTRNVAVMFGGIRGIPPGNTATSSNFETWELSFTGSAWTWTCTGGLGIALDGCPVSTTHPTARSAAQLAYSSALNQVVLFGGLVFVSGANANGSDTWTYNGAWTAQTEQISPEARSDSAMIDLVVQDDNDPTITFPTLGLVAGSTDAGVIDNVWSLTAATAWKRIPTPGMAGERSASAVVYDASSDRTLRIAGLLPPNATRDVFEFDGTVWNKIKSLSIVGPSDPGLRFLHAATYDSTRNRVIVVGGKGNDGLARDDVFIFNGTDWTKMPGTKPGPRFGAALAHDEKAGITVLFGGQAGANANKETWELDASGWTQITGAGGPMAEANAAMAYDRAHERLVLFDVTGATWTYANHAWSSLPTTATPGARSGARLVYNKDRKRVMLYGGNSTINGTSMIQGDLWELSEDAGTYTWTQVLTSTAPPPRTSPGLADHESLDALVLHGGGSSSGQALADTWLFQYRIEQ